MKMPISQLRQIIQEELINVFKEDRALQESQRQEQILSQLVHEELRGVLEEADDEDTIKVKKTKPKEETYTQTKPTEIKPRTKKQQAKDAKEKTKRQKKIKKTTILKDIDTDKKDPKKEKEKLEKLKKAFDKTPAKVKKKKTSTKK